jgi:hypothetical protein
VVEGINIKDIQRLAQRSLSLSSALAMRGEAREAVCGVVHLHEVTPDVVISTALAWGEAESTGGIQVTD